MKKLWRSIGIASLALLVLFASAVALSAAMIPDEISITDGGKRIINLSLPVTIHSEAKTAPALKVDGETLSDKGVSSVGKPITIESSGKGSSEISIDLMGLIPIKQVKVNVVDEKYLVPGGQSIGVMLYTKGALVVGTMDVEKKDGSMEPRRYGLYREAVRLHG